MLSSFSRKSLIFAMALAMPGLVAAQQAELPKESNGKARLGHSAVLNEKSTEENSASPDSAKNNPGVLTGLESALSLIPVSPLPGNSPVEPVLIHFESDRNRFVGDVDMEHFLRPGLTETRKKQTAFASNPAVSTGTPVSDNALNPNQSLKKNPVFNWSLSSLLQVSLDVIAARGIQSQSVTGQTGTNTTGFAGTPAMDSGKDNGGLGFSYAPPASSIATARPTPSQAASVFSLEGYQLGLRSSLDLGDSATLGFDFGLGQALSQEPGDESSHRLTVTSLGIGLGHKRFRASVNSDMYMNNRGERLNQQSTLGVQFDWLFDDSTLSVGARRPLVGENGQADRDFSSTIPYIRYRKEL